MSKFSSRLSSFRRFIVLMMSSFCFGGFLFYASVVVPAGTHVLGATTQGFVTRHVTQALNVSIVVCLCVWVWELIAGRGSRSRAAQRTLIGFMVLVAGCSLILFRVHSLLVDQLITEEMEVVERSTFYGLHRVYLWTSTLQWLASLPVFWIIANPKMDEDSGDRHQAQGRV